MSCAIVCCLMWYYVVPPAFAVDKFGDVPSAPEKIFCYDAVEWAVESKVTGGFKDGTFRPRETCTKKQSLTFLWRHFVKNKNPDRYQNCNDMEEATKWAVNMGMESSGFDENAPCSRADFVRYLYKAVGCPDVNLSGLEETFQDVTRVASYATAVMWAYRNDITKGVDVGFFGPDVYCNRGQIMTFLWRYAK